MNKEERMKRPGIFAVVVVLVGFFSAGASAQQDLVETISRDCKSEIARFCGSVSPGRSRVIACLYANIDKLTSDCGFALIDAAPELDSTVAKLALVAKGCGNDLRAFCPRVRPGEGRLLGCLSSNKDTISFQCREALKAGGLNEF
jgi:Golgi apparatus protein 1